MITESGLRLWLTIPVVLASAFFACSKSAEPGSGGSETNWLKSCGSQSDCSESMSCECGICTKTCESAEDCSTVSGASTCLVAETLDNGSCRVVSGTTASQGVCVARCEIDSDCNDSPDFECERGICVAVIKETPKGDGSFETKRGLVFEEDDVTVTETEAGTVPEDTVSASADGNIIDENTVTDGSVDSVGDENVDFEVRRVAEMQFPFPQCPCTVDAAEGIRAPKYGDVPSNSYGSPEVLEARERACGTNSLTSLGGIFDMRYAFGSYDESDYQGLEDRCLFFIVCTIHCTDDAACPSVDSGSAIPVCSNLGDCRLACGSNRPCPDGMTCVSGTDGSVCLWPQDSIEQGCPAFCEQDPIPRECPNFCAPLLVACDPEKGMNCCEGLLCSSEGYCVEE